MFLQRSLKDAQDSVKEAKRSTVEHPVLNLPYNYDQTEGCGLVLVN